MATHALKAASEALAKNKVSHICFTLDGPTSVFKVIGDNVNVAIKKKLEEAIREGGEQAESVSRTKLFARPGTAHPPLQQNYTGHETTPCWNLFFWSFLSKT